MCAWFGTTASGLRAKAAVKSKRRRLREAGVARDPEVRRRVWETHNGICHLCKLPVPFDRMQVEHVEPLAKGGADVEENLAPSHGDCNAKKGARTGPKKKGLRRTRWVPKRKKAASDGDVF